MKKITSKIFRKLGNLSFKISEYLLSEKSILLEVKTNDNAVTMSSILIEKGNDRNLYKTRFGTYLWLKSSSCIDESIINTGVWEDYTTDVVNRLVKPNDYVLDIGANIGYFSVIFSKLVGENGKVFAFEPTSDYLKTLKLNLAANNISHCEVLPYGLSNKEQELEIYLNVHSATLHDPLKNEITPKEIIKLDTLDNFITKNKIDKIDFIKIDVDGHEPLILEGAWETLEKYKPIILLEISHMHYLKAGYNAWNFYKMLKDKQYFIYSEKQLQEIKDETSFLIECGNFAYSSNIVISRKQLYN